MTDKITTELDFALIALKERGFKTEYKPGAWDDNSFYRIVSSVKWQSFGHPNAARKEIEKVQIEKENLLFFLAFEPKYDIHGNGTIDLVENLKEDLKKSKAARGIPTRRDMYAASEFLQRAIHMTYWKRNGVQKEVIDPPFTSYVADEIIYILSVSQGNKTAYIQLKPMDGAAAIDIAEHSQCQGLAFRRSFGHQLHVAEETNTGETDNNWICDRCVPKDKDKCYYYSLSKAMYGTHVYHHYVRKLIVKCLRENMLADVFFDSLDDDNVNENVRHKEKERARDERRKEYINRIEKKWKTPGKPEVFAAAYIYRAHIFVEKKYMKNYDLYLPLSLPKHSRQKNSFIKLTHHYTLLIPTTAECSCLMNKPSVEYIESINSEHLESLAFKFVVKKRSMECCPGKSRHDRHRHLDEFCQTTTAQCTLYTSGSPTPSPDDLDIDGRILDKVSGYSGTFQQCLHKLIYGTDEVSDDFEVRKEAPDKNYLGCIAQWLKKDIFIYSSWSQSWEVYRPGEDPRSARRFDETRHVKPCRFYITLFYDHSSDRYDILTPRYGCNCTMWPPTFVKRNTDQRQTRRIQEEDRHNPLAEFLLDENIHDSFSDETQSLLLKKGYSQIHEVFHRPDMRAREVDEGHSLHSLYTCLSKEIFGNEEQAVRIEELVAREMLDNADIYVRLLDVMSRLKLRTQNLQNDVNKTLVPFLLHFGHLPLLAAATVFQTPIYVLKVEPTEEEGWKSSWSSFTQVRRKKAPLRMPTIQSKCRQSGKSHQYYVTLLQDPYGNFFRIVPGKVKVCNCQLEEPDIPGDFVSRPRNKEEIRSRTTALEQQMEWEAAENEIIHTFRRLDNALGQNLRNLRQLISLISTQLLMYDLIVAVFESRRRDVNIASITGGFVSTAGTVLLILGFALAPVTAGSTLPMSVAGGVMSGIGSTSVIGAKITEGVLTKHQLQALITVQELLDVLSKEADRSNRAFVEMANEITNFVDGDMAEIGENTAGITKDMSPAFGRFVGSFHIIPVLIARITARISSVIVGSIIGGVSLAIDAAIVAYAAYNLNKGNKTSTSEMIRKNADLLRASKVKLESYVHGNVY